MRTYQGSGMTPETLAQLREELSAAGFESDGHVTNGSLNAQMEVVGKWLNTAAAMAEQGRW